MLFDAGSGARPRVESTPIALPPARHEARAGVTGDAGAHGVQRVAPAAVGGGVTQADPGVRRERREPGAQAGVAVGPDPVTGGGAVGVDARRPAPERHRGVDLGDVGGVDLDQGQVVVGAGVGVGGAELVLGDPGAVGQGAVADDRALGGEVAVVGEVDLGAQRHRGGAAPVGVGRGPGAGAVGGVARRRRCRRRRCRRSSRCTGHRRCTSSCRGGSRPWRPAPSSGPRQRIRSWRRGRPRSARPRQPRPAGSVVRAWGRLSGVSRTVR